MRQRFRGHCQRKVEYPYPNIGSLRLTADARQRAQRLTAQRLFCESNGNNDGNDGDDNDDDEEIVFSIREGDDLGWLGYFIGRNQSLDKLFINFMPEERERVDAFIDGVSGIVNRGCHNPVSVKTWVVSE